MGLGESRVVGLIKCVGAYALAVTVNLYLSKLHSLIHQNGNPKFYSVRSVVLWRSAALTALRLPASDLQLLSHIPARDRSNAVSSRENHPFF